MTQNEFLRGQRINPKPVNGKETVADLVDNAFLAYNAGRLAEGCRLFAERMLEEGVVRIYDIFFDYDVLLSTDRFVREVSARDEFQRPMSTAEYHYLLGGYVLEREKALGLSRKSVLGAAHAAAVPIYTSSPGDSSIGMTVAEQALSGSKLRFDVSADVNETSAIVFSAKNRGGKSGVLSIGV